MTWKFEKPIKGDPKPLTTEVSFRAMVKQLAERTKDHIINIYMPPPNKLDSKSTFVRVSPMLYISNFHNCKRSGKLAKMIRCCQMTLNMTRRQVVEVPPWISDYRWYLLLTKNCLIIDVL